MNHPIWTEHDDSSEVKCGENSEPEGKEQLSLAWESAPDPQFPSSPGEDFGQGFLLG